MLDAYLLTIIKWIITIEEEILDQDNRDHKEIILEEVIEILSPMAKKMLSDFRKKDLKKETEVKFPEK